MLNIAGELEMVMGSVRVIHGYNFTLNPIVGHLGLVTHLYHSVHLHSGQLMSRKLPKEAHVVRNIDVLVHTQIMLLSMSYEFPTLCSWFLILLKFFLDSVLLDQQSLFFHQVRLLLLERVNLTLLKILLL